MSDITSQSLTSLVNNIKEKKLSSEEVTKAFVDRSEKSKELNSYITEDFSNAIDKDHIFSPEERISLINKALYKDIKINKTPVI